MLTIIISDIGVRLTRNGWQIGWIEAGRVHYYDGFFSERASAIEQAVLYAAY
jgi:hypothetical protein